jgi:hypothetical protein
LILSPAYATMKPGQKARLLTLFARVTDLMSNSYDTVASFMYDTSLELGSIESQLAANELRLIVADSDAIKLSTKQFGANAGAHHFHHRTESIGSSNLRARGTRKDQRQLQVRLSPGLAH